ncbi:carboxymuconolactone decarboxylase family protein [Frankia sp. CNm7]|uniref:Carboxymuconolactone decarboxylase family protein n=1 Tax=Frankia nepalensis TaxID=1836974 RepID=A0A937USR4_9ACTN|nr:carboxymuconolactone decarboxylase family protein [Frankia nepalensis]MBL7500980.1 carboxymuconolactone decarboxylase family protein [Frankia nepalensis]MBL7512474.1 carboxymuconolactone decarboxylase family protein [Frankia nepalensis]MBL7521540.1 carboxymuconolactone decarboxylase family protein [Frankia nepalensis]MBL7632777.1 carboxymuconolactone decarboxylase family protein [Frankia nepalensis]
MARVEPLRIKQWPAQMRHALAAMDPPERRHARPVLRDRPKSMNTLGTFAHYPALAQAFFTFNGHVIMATTLSERQRELLVLRVATLRKSAYEWAQHIYMARDAGLTDEEIARVSYGPDAPFWSPLEAALLRAVDELVGEGKISDLTWAVLAGELDTQQLLDVIFTVGAYETIAWLMRSFDLELDDELTTLRSRDASTPAPAERNDP